VILPSSNTKAGHHAICAKHSNQNKRSAEQRASTRAAPHLCPIGTAVMVLVGRCVSQQALLAQLVHGQVGCGD
jgi:hypothetical protein